jgi:glutamyl endopeptidase
MVFKNLVFSMAMVSMFTNSASAATEETRGLGGGIDPHQVVSSDGQGLFALEDLPGALSMESFEGLAPQGSSLMRFEDSGAALDGARQVLGEEPDGWVSKSIIGPDSRAQILETTSFPWRAVAHITFQSAPGRRESRCSGWFFGPDLVVTAGSCLHSGKPPGSWATNVRVYPGRNGAASPFGFCAAKRLYAVQGWTVSRDERYDYGAIKLDCTVGNTVGWFAGWNQAASLSNLQQTLSGYPSDKSLTQWKSTGVVAIAQTSQVFYSNDVAAGEAGSPIFQVRATRRTCGGYCVLAIHTSNLHGSSDPHNKNNHGTRLTLEVMTNLISWRNAL